MPKYIVLSGKKQSGKTTSAKFIKNEIQARYPERMVEIVSFADPIKQFCKDVIGLTKEQVYGTEEQKNTPTHIRWEKMPKEIRNKSFQTGALTAREVMQIFGTDILRNFFDYDIWAKAPFNKSWGFTDYIIIDDCRFPNEADISLLHDATLIRLTRDVLGTDQHISEKAMDEYPKDKYHFIVDNNHYKDITNLFSQLNSIIRKIMS